MNLLINKYFQLIKLSKSNVGNGETQAEVDVIDNNNEWKVSASINLSQIKYLC